MPILGESSRLTTAVQNFVPDSLRNAATALQVTIVLGINPLGGALTGWTIEHFGANRGSAALGVATLLAVVVLTLTSSGINFRKWGLGSNGTERAVENRHL